MMWWLLHSFNLQLTLENCNSNCENKIKQNLLCIDNGLLSAHSRAPNFSMKTRKTSGLTSINQTFSHTTTNSSVKDDFSIQKEKFTFEKSKISDNRL